MSILKELRVKTFLPFWSRLSRIIAKLPWVCFLTKGEGEK